MHKRRVVSLVERAVIVAAVCLLGADKPRNRHATESGPVFRPIPVGAIKIPLPHIEQPDGSSCGAASLMSICSACDSLLWPAIGTADEVGDRSKTTKCGPATIARTPATRYLGG